MYLEKREQMAGKIILASSSPRRADILKKIKLQFEIMPSPYIEEHTTTVFSYEFIENLAYNKAFAVAKLQKEPSLVIGADTVVVLDNEILGKPEGKEEAYNMLKRLSGKTHFVVTSIVVINSSNGEFKKNSTTSYVTFEELTDEQINYYIENFKPFDKAGAYGIQEMPDGYIKSYTGDLENIIGLSSKALKELLSS